MWQLFGNKLPQNDLKRGEGKKYIEMRYCKLYTNGQVNAVIIFLVVLMVYRNTFNCWCILNLFCEDLNLFFFFTLESCWEQNFNATGFISLFPDIKQKFMSPRFIWTFKGISIRTIIWYLYICNQIDLFVNPLELGLQI